MTKRWKKSKRLSGRESERGKREKEEEREGRREKYIFNYRARVAFSSKRRHLI